MPQFSPRLVLPNPQVQFQQRIPQVGMGGNAPANMPMYGQLPPPGQQIFFGQPPPGLLPPQPGYGYQQQVLAPGMRPGMQAMPNYYVPVVQVREFPRTHVVKIF